MKKISSTIVIIFLAVSVFSQTISPKEFYLQKSKRQRNTGWVLLGAGSVIATLGIFLENSNERQRDVSYGPNFKASDWMFVTGVTADIASVPFFISSSVNRRKAVKISLTNQQILAYAEVPRIKFYPAITLRFKLN